MRDPARINRILSKFAYIWSKGQDLRFNQIVGNVTGKGDWYYLEDDKFEQLLDDYIAKFVDRPADEPVPKVNMKDLAKLYREGRLKF